MKTKSISKITLHGRVFIGVVVSRKMQKSAKVSWERTFPLRKYERVEKRRSSVIVHVPDNIEVKEGDIVTIKECRPISKTKHFVIIENASK